MKYIQVILTIIITAIFMSLHGLDNNLRRLDSLYRINDIDMRNVFLTGEIVMHTSPADKGTVNPFTYLRVMDSLYYSDNKHILLSRPDVNILVNSEINQVILTQNLSVKKQKTTSALPQMDILSIAEKSIAGCEIKNNEDGGLIFNITYAGKNMFSRCEVLFDSQSKIRKMTCFYNKGFDHYSYDIVFGEIYQPTEDLYGYFSENEYVIKKNKNWQLSGNYQDYVLQIINYDGSF